MIVIRRLGLYLTAAGFVVAGVLHFVITDAYVQVMPPIFPAPRLLVLVSGVAEIVGGLGLLVPRLRRAATVGLVALLVAVWPVHFWLLVEPGLAPVFPYWLLVLRLPAQIPMMAWVWWVGTVPADGRDQVQDRPHPPWRG